MTTYYVTSEELLGDNYLNIDIGCSSYNPTIDGTVTVTVTVKDVYGDAVSGEEVTVTASEGNFTAYNGTAITGAASHTGTTDSNGQFTLTYTASVWGLITFTAPNASTQIKVKGFKSKSMWNGTLYYNNEMASLVLNWQGSGTYNTATWTDSGAFDTVPSSLRPKQNVYSTLTDIRMVVRVNYSTGKLQYVTGGASISNPYFQCVLTWPLP